MQHSTVHVFQDGEEYEVNLNVHPQVEAMMNAPVGTEARYLSWVGVCGTIMKAVEIARHPDVLS